MSGTARVPIEFIGKARAFRMAATAEHACAVAMMDRLALPLRARYHSRQPPSPHAFARVAKAWREQIPASGRLRLNIKHDRKRLVITEVRTAPSDFHFSEWPEGVTESCIVITVGALIVAERCFKFTCAPAASVSLHALARRFQRGWDNSDAAIRMDLLALACPAEGVMEATGDFTVRTAGGRWVGTAPEIEDRGRTVRILVPRTFISDEMTARVEAPAVAAA